MAKVSDLISRSGVDDAASGLGAGSWYGQVLAPAPTAQGNDLFVRIPDLDYMGANIKWGPCLWRLPVLPTVGDDVLVIFDNRQQPWVVSVW